MGFLRDAVSVLGARAVMLGAMIAGGALLARALGPEGVGIIAAVTVLPTILLGFAELGIRQSIVYHIARGRLTHAQVIPALAVILALAGSIGVAFAVQAYDLLGNMITPPGLVLLAALIIPFRLITSYSSGLFLATGTVREFNQARWIPELVRLFGIVVLLGLGTLDVFNAVAAGVIGHLALALYLLWLIGRRWSWTFKFSPRIAGGLVRVGVVYAAALFIIGLNYRIDIVFLQRMVPAADVGHYTVAVGLVELLWEVPSALGVVLFVRSAASSPTAQTSDNVGRVLRVSLLVTAIAASCLALAASSVVELLYGRSFAASAEAVKILLPGVVAFTIFKILNADLAARGKPYIAIWLMLPAVALNVVGNLILIPKFGVAGAAWASTASYCLAAALFLFTYAVVAGTPIRALVSIRRSDFAALRRAR